MAEQLPILPAKVPKDFVLSKCEYFVNVQLWPIETRLNPKGWLENFTNDEMDHAVHLLNAFAYFSSHLVTELLRAAFQGLSKFYVSASASYAQNEAAWSHFRKSLLITYVTGETPNATDSGLLFARLARQHLAIEEERIVSPEIALAELLTNGPRPIVFVDDFVGSGQQFVKTWHREVVLPNGQRTSFDRVSRIRGTSFFYCPLICAHLGQRTIEHACKAVRLVPAHFLSEQYSALSQASLVWPERLQPTSEAFLEKASKRAGVPDEEWRGYCDLGLAVAFEHCVPDATLPLFYFEQNGWRPLIKRT